MHIRTCGALSITGLAEDTANRNDGTEGRHAMNGSTTDLTSHARFELAVLSRAEPSR